MICYVKLCCVVLCCAVLCCAVLCCAVLCCAVLCCAVLCCAVLCCAVLCCAVLCCAVLCCAVLCCAVLCCAVLCCAVLCCAVLCCAVLCCAVLCCAVLCCAMLIEDNRKSPVFTVFWKFFAWEFFGSNVSICVFQIHHKPGFPQIGDAKMYVRLLFDKCPTAYNLEYLNYTFAAGMIKLYNVKNEDSCFETQTTLHICMITGRNGLLFLIKFIFLADIKLGQSKS